MGAGLKGGIVKGVALGEADGRGSIGVEVEAALEIGGAGGKGVDTRLGVGLASAFNVALALVALTFLTRSNFSQNRHE